MPRQLSSEEIEVLARRRAGAKMGWYIHACVYVLVNLALFAMSDFGFGHRQWQRFPIFGWGIGLALHGISVFMLGKGSAFRERMVERERERLQRQQERR
jgi:hypothetical protein